MVLQAIFGRAWPTPVAKPMAPFFFAGIIISYGVYKLQGTLMDTEEWRNDPRHPDIKSGKRQAKPSAAEH